MQPRTDRPPGAHLRRRRALVAGLAAAVALTASGCGSRGGAPSQQTTSQHASGTPSIVTAQQVVTTCYHDYFYNGILPESAAKSNCRACVKQTLRKLGIQPSPGETETDLLTGVRLPASDINSLQSACNESDASAQ